MRRGWILALVLASCAADGQRLDEWTLETSGRPPVQVRLPNHLRSHLPPGEVDYFLSIQLQTASEPRALVADCFHGPLRLSIDGNFVADEGDPEIGWRRFVIPAGGSRIRFQIHRQMANGLGFGAAPRLVDLGDRTGPRIAAFNRYTARFALGITLVLSFLYLAFYLFDRRRREYAAVAAWLAANLILPSMQLGIFQSLFGSYGPNVQNLVGLLNLCAFLYFIHLVFDLEPVSRWWLAALGTAFVLRLATVGRLTPSAWLMFPQVLLMIAVNLYGGARLLWLAARPGPRRSDALLLGSIGVVTFTAILCEVAWAISGRQPLAGVHVAALGVGFQAIFQALVVSRQHAARQRALEHTTEELRRQVSERSRDLSEALARLQQPRPGLIEPGATIQDRYRVVRKLGAGGMGTVHEVERLSDGRRLALKTLHGSVDSEAMSRFAREAQIAAQLDHPNVVSVLDVDISKSGILFLVMELVSGSSLAEERGRFGDRGWALPILRQIAAALEAMHARGIVHRDLKPANVLLAAGVAKVADFGIASLDSPGDDSTLSVGAQLTRAGAFMGTPAYMAPELERGAQHATPASDLFAFGVVAYQLLSGKMPFAEPPVLARLSGRTAAPHLALEDPLGAFVDRCLSFNPRARPTASEARSSL